MIQTVRRHGLPLAVWTAVWGFFFAPLLFGWVRLSHSDFSGQFYAYAQAQARALWSGRLPLWSPGSFGGLPMVADPQAAVFYPVRWLTILLAGPDLSYYALEVEGLFHIWLLGTGLYFFVYAVLADSASADEHTAARWGALLGAVTFGLSGYIISYPLLQLAILETWAWLPLALLLLRRAMWPERIDNRYFLGSALLMAVAITAGHPQTALHAGYIWGAYFLFMGWRSGRSWRQLLGGGALLILIALGSSAAAWLPVVRYWPFSVRLEAGYDFVSSGQLTINFFQGFIPGSLTLWSPEYVGIIGLMAALAAWIARQRLEFLKNEVNFWGGTAILALWLSLGDKGILFQLWYGVAPGFQLFRQQERLMGTAAFALAVLAGIGSYAFLTRRLNRSLVRRILSWSGGGIAVAVLFLAIADHIADPAWPTQAVAAAGVWLMGAAGLWWGTKRNTARSSTGSLPHLNLKRSSVPALMLVLLAATDLFGASRAALRIEPLPPDPFWIEPAWLDPVRASEGRLDPGFFYFANLGEALELESVRGISPLKHRQLAELERLPLSKMWPLLGVTYGIFEGGPPADLDVTVLGPAETSVIPGETNPGAVLVALNRPVPRANMRYRAAVPQEGESVIDLMLSDQFDPYHDIALDSETAGRYEVAPPPTPPIIEKLDEHTTAWRVNTAAPGYLTLAEWHLPGQRVTVNGDPVDPLPANGGLIALFLPAGDHTVTLDFRPPAVLWGGLISLLTIVGAFWAVFGRDWAPHPAGRAKTRLQQEKVLGRETVAQQTPEQLSSFVTRHSSLATRHSSLVFRISTLPLLLLFLAFALRMIGIDAQELRGDEAFSYLFANKPLLQIVPDLIVESDTHPPLHYLLLGVWIKAAGISELSMRFISLMAGMLSLPIVYQIGRRLWGRSTGFLALTLATFSPSLIWLSQDMRNQYTLAMLFTTAATWLVLQQPSGREKIGRWLAYAVLAALAMYSHYYAIFALLGHGVYLLATPARRPQLRWWLVSGAAAALAFVPWLWTIVSGVTLTELNDPSTPRLATYLTQIGIELGFGASFGAAWIRWGALGIAFLIAAGWRATPVAGRSRLNGETLLGAWLVLAAGGIFLVLFRRAIFNPYYIAVAAPAGLLLAAAGLRQLWRRERWQPLVPLILGGWLIGMGISSVNGATDSAFSKSWGYRALSAALMELEEPGDLFVAHFPDPSFDYYLRDSDTPRTIAPRRPGQTPEEVRAYLSELAANYERLWFVPAHRSGWDPDDVAYNYLEFHTVRERAARFGRLELLGYRPLDHVAHAMEPVSQRIGPLIFHGAFVTIDGRPDDPNRPVKLEPGQTVRVSMIWSAAEEVDAGYTMFVHLLAPDGRLITQHDGIPVGGTRPTFTWPVGELFLDVHELVVPADGGLNGATLVIGAYNSETIKRLRFEDGQDSWVALQSAE